MYALWIFKGKLFENGKRYAKSDNTIQKYIKERIQNNILHVQFERKISSINGVYVYNYLKRQKKAIRVKMLTSKWHWKQEYLCLDHSNAFGLSRNIFFCHEHREGGILDYVSLMDPRAS